MININNDPLLLVSAVYDNQQKKTILKFYNSNLKKLILWKDTTEHRPYCYSKSDSTELEFLINRDDVIKITKKKINDLLNDKVIDVSKIIVKDPLAIGGTQSDKSIRNIIETWESDIKYYENYLYDNLLIVGKYYKINNNVIVPYEFQISNEIKSILHDLMNSTTRVVDINQFNQYILDWAKLLEQPIPKIKRLSFDIEVESEKNRIPDPKLAEKKVIAIALVGSDDLQQVHILKNDDNNSGKNNLDAKIIIKVYDNEKELILNVFNILSSYPFIITFNGDGFDVPYLVNRAYNLGIKNDLNPFKLLRDSATMQNGVHIDLYRTLSNKSFQIYAFNNKYTDFSLNSISKALLNKSKLYSGTDINNLNQYQLAEYCFNDAKLTYELTSFNNDLLMNLLVVITRIAKMPIDDISRMGVSQWIRSLLYFEHRKRNAIIPRRNELEKKFTNVTNNAIIKDKKFRGGLVVIPKEGIHFNVTVMDFASLYPSIIKVNNLSYETVRCPHKECTKNTIPQTSHWVCNKKNGLTSLLIGSLRDLRVNYYKNLAKSNNNNEKKKLYEVVSQALKVILNASYGVMGAEIFPLYFLPAAEATTAIGRHIILKTIEKCKEREIEVLYGDTDSLFVKNPTEMQIKNVIENAKQEHGINLEIEKEYRYVVLSNRKKNYFGVTKNGDMDVKGLTGKKSHTPPFIKKLFQEILSILREIKTIDDFKIAKNIINNKISEYAKKVLSKQIELSELTFNVMVSKSPAEYKKTIPQHIRAAKLLESIREIKKGDIISYVKVLNKPGVKPVELAKKEEIDSKKYMEFMEATLDQITSSMKIDFDEILGRPKQIGLDKFFW